VQPASARRSTSTEPAARRAAPRIALLVLLGAAAAAHAGGDEDAALRQETVQLARQADLLEKRLELASGDEFYLLLDPGAAKLQLMLKGAVLRDYGVLGLEVGSPRVAFRSRRLVAGWRGRVWSEGNLNPARERERFELVAVPAESAAADSAVPAFKLPPTPEEAYPVPHRYHIRYAGGLSLEVRPQEADETVGFWKRFANGARVWYRDFVAAVRPTPEDAIRLRMVLRPEDAASLYRALPPDTRLLVMPSS
jgi:hypothetical protein